MTAADTAELPTEAEMQSFVAECNRLTRLARDSSKPPGARIDAIMKFMDLAGVTDMDDFEDEDD